jgi:hypothetical protein
MKDGISRSSMSGPHLLPLTGPAPVPPMVDASIAAFRIQATVEPPTRLQASTELKLRIRSGGEGRCCLSCRAISRSMRSRRLAAQWTSSRTRPSKARALAAKRETIWSRWYFPAPLAPGQELKLRFTYAGDVLSEAGNGLLYVGERGTWYPNLGLSPAQFDMEFHYPANWTLVATGKQTWRGRRAQKQSQEAAAEKVSRWTLGAADSP